MNERENGRRLVQGSKAAGERGVYICLKGALVWLRKQLDAVQDWS